MVFRNKCVRYNPQTMDAMLWSHCIIFDFPQTRHEATFTYHSTTISDTTEQHISLVLLDTRTLQRV